ncbi:MAG: T9SS type A sorting domain-containing protein [Chitinophagales bacterium]|nr:T9SS type A sorting domain-containing protein [Chitinophagales bacterium]
MKRMSFFALLAFAMLSLQLNAQRSCGAMDHLHQMMQDPTVAQNRAAIEQFTANWVSSHPNGSSRAIVTIPVVVHVLYRTTSQNISDAQIQSQIDVLNADFAKLNADAANTPSAFQSLVANVDIQFCLAQRDPSGNPTTGIIRKSTTVTSFSTNDNIKRSANGGSDAWPRDSYLNIWVGNISGGILGYAQFPGGSASTDGVVINYTAFGTNGTAAAPFNKGRTATHEVGHWLNLYHIWGDDGTGCTGSDNVSDTPNQADENYGCPSFPTVSCSNGPNGDMFMNYMDYTDDACMFMFTNGQKARMQALFATGGARAALLNSLGCQAPNVTCGTPTGLAASGITTTAGTISWSAVSGATSYNLQYKLSTASTYTTVAVTGTNFSLSGLTAGTTYNYQVQAVCASGASAYSTTASFTTLSEGGCGTPGSLASSGITASGATVSWSAVSGATSYNLQYKLSSASTFTTVSVTGTSYAFTGLAASSTYNYQVQAVCGGTTGSYAALASFTTSAASTCTDTYESNNSISAAKTIAVGTDIRALIGTAGDNDYFKFTSTSSQKYIQITLTNLPADYDVRLYRSNGSQVAISQNSGTTSETINYNNGSAGTYYVRVYGYNNAFNASSCYTLKASISSSRFRVDGTEDETLPSSKLSDFKYQIFPNPTNGQVNVELSTVDLMENASIQVTDIAGKTVFFQNIGTIESNYSNTLDLSYLENGMYFIAVLEGNQRKQVQKVLLAK